MKLKNRDKNEMERRLEAIDFQFVQHDRVTQAAMLAIVTLGAVVLVVVAGYLVCSSWITGY
jgi:hypothetical protein